MHRDVAALYDELMGAEAFDLHETRPRILELFGEVQTEDDRVHLLTILHVLTNATVRAVEADGKDTADLRNAIVADKRMLALKEAMGPKELAEPVELLRILDREIAAGRMVKDDFYQHTKDAADVIGPPLKPRKPLGIFKRR